MTHDSSSSLENGARVTDGADEPRDTASDNERRGVIWLVDDSTLQREATRRSLDRNHEVLVFNRAAPMLERLSTDERPDIVVLDWHMPDISGLEACRYVRTVADGAELPILVLTASGEKEDLLAGLNAGANDFVRKPCDETELQARVAALMRTRQLHAQLAKTELALREEASFRERFLAILAHDLRQPLNVFAFGSELLSTADTSPSARGRVIEKFGRATARMQRMIGELLDFSRSRPQGGGMPITSAAVDFVVILRDVVEEIRLAHPAREIAVETVPSSSGKGDADRLSQVVSNLLENALAHSTPATPVRVVLSESAGEVSMVFENQGAPIAADLWATLFDPFRRGQTRSSGDRGLGLGLYIVDQIVRAHGGAASVSSDGGKNRFAVTLPIAGKRPRVAVVAAPTSRRPVR